MGAATRHVVYLNVVEIGGPPSVVVTVAIEIWPGAEFPDFDLWAWVQPRGVWLRIRGSWIGVGVK